MTVTEKLEQVLREEGFFPKRDEDNDLIFKCEGLTYLSMNNEDDEDFLAISMPAIFDATDDNRDLVFRAMNIVNAETKVGKLYLTRNDSVWVNFEIILDNDPGISDILMRAIKILQHSREKFYEKLQEIALLEGKEI